MSLFFHHFRIVIPDFNEKKFKQNLVEFTQSQNAKLSHVLNECKRLSAAGKPMPWESKKAELEYLNTNN